MTHTVLSGTEINQIKELLSTDAWQAFKKLFDSALTTYQLLCELVKDDHRFYQGKLAGLREIEKALDQIQHPPETRPSESTPFDHFRNRPRVADPV